MQTHVEKFDEFDYVIVGAGTAGCVLAERLSEDRAIRVCLIEAGSRDTHPFIHVPALVGAAINTKSIGWGYSTTAQPHLAGRVIPMPRGRVLGGCSSINGMVYFRGHAKDFDEWAEAGNPGWSFAELLPYFRRSENNENWPESAYHGAGGPMNVKDIEKRNPLVARFLESAYSLGFSRCDDFNGADPEGFGPRQATIRAGRRVSSATAFLRPASARPNLTIITHALARRVLISEGRASGVEIERDGTVQTFRARREVVLSAGAIGTPALLMRSGIGDGAALQALGIGVEHHNPQVGAELADHIAASVQMHCNDTTSYGISLRAMPRGAWNLCEYLVSRAGPLASNVFEGVGFARSEPELDRPDLHIVFQPARRNQSTFPLPLGHGFAINVALTRPRSKGSVTLASADCRAAPLIDPNYLGAEADMGPLLKGIGIARKILASAPFVPYQAREFLPGPDVRDEEELRNYVRRYSSTVHHPVGTCKMGNPGGAVVDSQLRVHGIAAIRIADVVMVAEKAADLILGRNAPMAERFLSQPEPQGAVR